MAVNDIYEVVIGGKVKGEWCETTLHLRETTADVSAIPAQNVAASAFTHWVGPIAAILSADEATLDCIYARRIHPTAGVPWTQLTSTVGEVVGDALPSNTAVVLSWVTALGGGSKRGRNWIWGISENYQNGGNLGAAPLALIEAFVGVLLDGWGPGGSSVYRLCVWSPTLGAAQDVIGGIVRTNLGAMRSRRQRPGTV